MSDLVPTYLVDDLREYELAVCLMNVFEIPYEFSTDGEMDIIDLPGGPLCLTSPELDLLGFVESHGLSISQFADKAACFVFVDGVFFQSVDSMARCAIAKTILKLHYGEYVPVSLTTVKELDYPD